MALFADRRPRRRTNLRSGPELRLGPSGDTGVTLGDKNLRPRPRRRRRSNDPWVAPLLIVVAALLLAAVALASPATGVHVAKIADGAAARPLGAGGTPRLLTRSPVFATYGALRVHLPVPAESVTTVAFHQAAFSHAVAMTSLVPEVSVGAARTAAQRLRAAKAATATPDASTVESPTPLFQPGTDIWGGHVVRLWRSARSGKPNTATDVGAPPGTPVVAPVDGTVVYVRTYKLYGKYDDYEVHISPKDAPDVDVVLIHISDVCVKPGDAVEAGLTRVACVRRLSKLMSMQLAQYTADGGDHTHMQINRLPSAGHIWVSLPSGPAAMPFETSTASAAATAAAAP